MRRGGLCPPVCGDKFCLLPALREGRCLHKRGGSCCFVENFPDRMSAAYLDHLFERLHAAADAAETEAVQHEIWSAWMQSGDEQTNTAMRSGVAAMAEAEYSHAVALFSGMIERNPDYAEAWNKRATAYYMRGDFKTAISDIEQVLRLEPRHFGALSGLASIYLVIGDKRMALDTLTRLQRICAHHPGLESQLRNLHRQDRKGPPQDLH